MTGRPFHRQVWTKVNAPVDEGVVGLIDALSSFPGLRSIESCQGPPAWVCFEVGVEGWSELAALVLARFGPALGDLATAGIHVTGAGRARGELTVQPDALDDTVSLLHRLAAQAEAATGAYRTCACSCDTSRTSR